MQQQVKEYIYRKQNSLFPQGQLPENLFSYRCFHFFLLVFSNKNKITGRRWKIFS